LQAIIIINILVTAFPILAYTNAAYAFSEASANPWSCITENSLKCIHLGTRMFF